MVLRTVLQRTLRRLAGFSPFFPGRRPADNTLLSTALHNMSNGLVMIGADGLICLHNDRVSQLFHLDPGEVSVGMCWRRFLGNLAGHLGWDEMRLNRIIANHVKWMAQSEPVRIEHFFDDGMVLNIVCRPLPGGGAVLTYEDVTENKRAQGRMTHMAFHDALTDLPNRRAFREELERACLQPGSASLLLVDMDGFKAVNDTFGHAAGDAVLVETARRLRRLCPPESFVARLGGDELAVMLAHGGEKGAQALADCICAGLAEPYAVGEQVALLGCSIGIAAVAEATCPDELQHHADLALYQAKENGRNRACRYEPAMTQKVQLRRDLARDLGSALLGNEFYLVYQPFHAISDNQVVAFEALLRWRHPQRGLVSPAEFIPVAEESGAIRPLGEWVINEACRTAATWDGDLRVCVNVSPVQLRGDEMQVLVLRALAASGLSPQRLELELTETAIVRDGTEIAASLAGLRALGIQVAMDDFGTGYSSLAHLCNLEIDRIKIDRSFVNTALEKPASHAVLRAVAQMGRDLGITTVGEGVENQTQYDLLRVAGCDAVQGYLFGQPLMAAEIPAYLARYRRGPARMAAAG